MKPTSRQLKELIDSTNENEITICKSIVDGLYLEYNHLEQQVENQKKVIDKLIELNQMINDSDYVYSQDEITTKNLDILKEVSE